jgi:hypothetical protein
MMIPTKEQILAWTEGELEGSALEQVEMWANTYPDEAEKMVSALETPFVAFASMPREVEPPYADFLNRKIQQQIEHEVKMSQKPAFAARASIFHRFRWVFAPVAVAVMSACYLVGTQVGKTMVNPVVADHGMGKVEAELVYVPSDTVSVEQFETDDAKVIVLRGLEPIADDDLAMVNRVAPKDSIRFASAESQEEQLF